MNNCLVYLHKKPCGEVFYVGIGSKKSRPKSKSGRNRYWKNVVNKHGYEVEVVLTNISREEACNIEIGLIKYYGRRDLKKGTLVNLTDGGDLHLGKKISKRQKELLRSYRLGSKLTDEHKKNISESLKGGKRTDAQKLKMSRSRKGFRVKDETKKKLSELNKGALSPVSRKVLDKNTGVIYDTMTSASINLGISFTTLHRKLNRKNKNNNNLNLEYYG